jgi:hypothetical protein
VFVEIQPYRQAIRAEVCGRCLDSDGHGHCRIDPVQECTLQMHLPLIVDIVNSIESSDMHEYVRALRHSVCARCRYQTVSGYCTARMNLDCALDRYLTLVVGVITDVKEGLRVQRARP